MTAGEAKKIACDFVRSRSCGWSEILAVKRVESGEHAHLYKDQAIPLAKHSTYWIVGFEPTGEPNDDAVYSGLSFGVCVMESTGVAMHSNEHIEYLLSGRTDFG